MTSGEFVPLWRRAMMAVENHDAQFWNSLPATKIVALDCEAVADKVTRRQSAAIVAVVDRKSRPIFFSRVYHRRYSFSVNRFTRQINGIEHDDLETGLPIHFVERCVTEIGRRNVILTWGPQDTSNYLNVAIDSLDVQQFFCQPLCDHQLPDEHIIGRRGVPVGACVAQPLSLADAARHCLGKEIQRGIHDPIEDASSLIDIFFSNVLESLRHTGTFSLNERITRTSRR